MTDDDLAAAARAAQVALRRLLADQPGIHSKLQRAAHQAGGTWTPGLRRRQAELAERLRAARPLITDGPRPPSSSPESANPRP